LEGIVGHSDDFAPNKWHNTNFEKDVCSLLSILVEFWICEEYCAQAQ